ncbi:hypothetical protein GTQ34_08095 [Muricauda sp. JGD-17]|uniref:Knr4/Smi1-like domain-containing protein n=1 Tax=Flagellimonas ochracea TaxID=2696472 RepID=A0A964TBL7_9FLAO|nr:SMI1/KNR4 family protein [Allomuricauda ochracea]NAY91875.1 hypothetical protein [Allomuricauda ochracea]
MVNYTEQIRRIKIKFQEARKIDLAYKTFGAARHKYHLNPPAKSYQVEAFEKQYGIQLPVCYKTFLLNIGNGGISYQNSGAGPYYGIYPLGHNLDQVVPDDPKIFLKKHCCLNPEMSDDEWENMTSFMDKDEISDEEYHTEFEKLYGGILPLGFQGCSFLHGLVLNGVHKAKVVNIEISGIERPLFSPDNNFLDWYERWLDEIIEADKTGIFPKWFGFSNKDNR